MRDILLHSRPNSPQFTYQVTVTAAQSTTPKFTFATGAPAALINWGDGSAYEAVTSGVELTHAYASGGIYTVRLLSPNQEKWLIQIDINTDKVSKIITPIQSFGKLTLFYAHSNAAWVQDISGWVLPASLAYFQIYSTSVSGDISGWVLPASLAYFQIHYTSLNGTPIFTSALSLRDFQYQNCALPQATIDAIVQRIYNRRMSFTYVAPTANVGGTNATPSGIYQDEDPPVTGKGFIYELVNDPEIEGFNKWTITYTA